VRSSHRDLGTLSRFRFQGDIEPIVCGVSAVAVDGKFARLSREFELISVLIAASVIVGEGTPLGDDVQ